MTAASTIPATLCDAVVRLLRGAAATPDGLARPAAVLWTDPRGEWQPIIGLLREQMPELLTLGEYKPEERTGPAIWLRCVVDRVLEEPSIPDEVVPALYLPGVGRQQLRAGEDCPWSLRPLIELMYRGVMWHHRAGHDWTVSSFLTSVLHLDVAGDESTRLALARALPEVAVTPVASLKGRLESEDFDKLLTGDPVRDLLRWMSDPAGAKKAMGADRWAAACGQCRGMLGFDPEKDGIEIAGERLGGGEGAWASVWARYEESPEAYPGVIDVLRRSKPGGLVYDKSRWPDENDDAEAQLRGALAKVPTLAHAQACRAVLDLDEQHRERRGWLWARLGLAPLARLLEPLGSLARVCATPMGAATPDDQAAAYLAGGWEADAAACQAMALTAPADEACASGLVTALLGPWLEDSARAFQHSLQSSPLLGKEGQRPMKVDAGGCLLFADGLRVDVAKRLTEQLEAAGMKVGFSHRWAALPTVTATAKPAATPLAKDLGGSAIPEDFSPDLLSVGKKATAGEIRKALQRQGYQVMIGEVAAPESDQARGWTEAGEIDSKGHKLGRELGRHVPRELERLASCIGALLDAGWSHVRVVTDHGWLYSPGGLPKVDLPKHLTLSRWARCAAIQGHSQVQVPTASWHWNAAEVFATAPGAACFNTTECYAHGGLSIQECLVPELLIEPATRSGVKASIRSITWMKMRCFLEVNAAGGPVTVDLRLERPNGESVVTKPKPLDSDGAASLVLAGDEHESANLVAVVLGPDGTVLAQARTKVGAS